MKRIFSGSLLGPPGSAGLLRGRDFRGGSYAPDSLAVHPNFTTFSTSFYRPFKTKSNTAAVLRTTSLCIATVWQLSPSSMSRCMLTPVNDAELHLHRHVHCNTSTNTRVSIAAAAATATEPRIATVIKCSVYNVTVCTFIVRIVVIITYRRYEINSGGDFD